MEFSGTFELDDATTDEVWLVLSDPAMIQHALPGCQFLDRVDDEDVDFDELREKHADSEPELTADPAVIDERAFEEGATYAAVVEISVGSVNPSFETLVTIDERDEPYMAASGEGSAGNSSFEMASWMELSAVDDGTAIDWNAEADVFGRIAQMGQRVINPVANRVVKRFFKSMQDQLQDLELEAEASAGATEADAEAAEAETDTAAGGDTGTGTGATTTPTSSAAGDTSASTDDDGDTRRSGGILARIKRLLGLGG